METATCKTCNTDKPIDQFRTYLARGQRYRRRACKACWKPPCLSTGKRQEERARTAARKGVTYFRGGAGVASVERARLKRQSPRQLQVMLCLEAHRAHREWLRERTPKPTEAERYRGRFATDPMFRAKEIRRSAANKKAAVLKRRGMTEQEWQAHKAAAPERARRYARAKGRARCKRVQQATPEWADTGAITRIYLQARIMREQGHDVHVDHHIPLNSTLVCGLHVEGNLRILPGPENHAKSNAFEPYVVLGHSLTER